MSDKTKVLIIARHGDTFAPGQTPTRVGARTDLPLVDSGRAQALVLGAHFLGAGLIPDAVYSSPLLRTRETARLIVDTCSTRAEIETLEMLREVDYGPDENQPEEAVIARIGKEALNAWDERGIVPSGWKVDPERVIADWISLVQRIEKSTENVFLAVTSNGIARFAPHITGDFEGFRQSHSLKLKTGSYGLLKYQAGRWLATEWNVRP